VNDGEDVKDPGMFAGAQARIEALFARILSPRLLRDLAQLFADLALVKDRFAQLARTSESLLLGPRARYVLVTAPSGSAMADAIFLHKKLGRLDQRSVGVILNRSDESPPPWLEVLRKAAPGWPAIGTALEQVDLELKTRRRAGDRLSDGLKKGIGAVPQLRTPTIEAADPAVIVRGLATALTPHLDTLAGR
jgi:hypothetical protein